MSKLRLMLIYADIGIIRSYIVLYVGRLDYLVKCREKRGKLEWQQFPNNSNNSLPTDLFPSFPIFIHLHIKVYVEERKENHYGRVNDKAVAAECACITML